MRSLGPYEIEREVARGGMGIVYRAHGPRGAVAIKVLLDQADDPRFLREAQAGLQLHHPGIVAVHELNHDPRGRPYLVLEWVEGESLEQRIRRDGPLPVAEAIRLTRLLCDALAYAHGEGVIHRDLKPANVLLTTDGRPRIADFGLTRLAGADPLTRTGTLLGTPAYMPPEQAAGEPRRMGPTCDVYSLGATLYAMLCGRPPFEGASTLNVLRAVLDDPAPSIKATRPEVPGWLDAAVRRCLAKEPEQRYATAEELEAALGPAPAPRHRPALVWLAACALLATAVGVTAAALSPAQASKEKSQAVDWLELVERATQLDRLGRHDESAALLAPLLGLQPRTAKEHLARALARDSATASHADLERALELDPDLVLALIARSRLARHRTDLAQADEDSARALRLAPNAVRALIERANVLALLGRREDSLRELERARGLAPASDGTRLEFAEAELRWLLGDLDLALAAIEPLESRWPGSATVPWMKAQVLLALRRVPEAIECMERSLAIRPDASRFATLARAYHTAGDTAGAERTYQRALDGAPNDRALCLEWTAFLTEVQGRLQDALPVLDRLIARDPRDYQAYIVRGALRSQLGQSDAALHDMREALLVRPDARHPRMSIGIIQFDQGNYRRAIEDLTESLEPGDPSLSAREQAEAYAYRALARGQIRDRLNAADDMARARAFPNLRADLRAALERLEAALSRR